MPSFNQIILVGNLTRDPELRYTPKGKAVLNGGIAVNEHWTTETGEKKERVTFVDFTIWDRAAETFAQQTAKGAPIFLCGRLQLDSWDDAGTTRHKHTVTVETFQFLGGKPESPAPSTDKKQKRG
ncbi:MAG TPA: single-stranded DNA-binding protein [Verrucomicrobiae bacterium]|nr:single-stranded DNA-binding protein [Verrucomicrobiae bacterium]